MNSRAWIAFLLAALAASGAFAESIYVPVAAHAQGVSGTFFVTDLRLHNTTASPLEVEIRFSPSGQPSAEVRETLTLAAREQRELPDVVASLFGVDGTGGIEVRTIRSGLMVASRTFNADPAGTYGQFVGGVSADEAASNGSSSAHLLHLSGWGFPGRSGYRTNIGVFEVAGAAATIRVEIFDAEGVWRGRYEQQLQAGAHSQVNDVFRVSGAGELEKARAVVSVTSGSGRALAYASVVDNVSSDQIYVPGIRLDRAPATPLWVVGVAKADGEGGTSWVTDLRIANLADSDRVVGFEFRPLRGESQSSPLLLVEPGQMLAIDDVVGSFFAARAVGALRIVTEPPGESGLVATARTYNAGIATYGQFVPARSAGLAVGEGAAATALGLAKIGSPGVDGFRSNAGLANVAAAAGSVRLELWTGAGDLAGWLERDLAAGEVVQWNDVFAATGTAAAAVAFVRFVPHGGAQVLGWASVVDNRTGDPVYSPAAFSGLDLPNLVVDTPSGWSGPLVTSSSPGGTTSTSLYEGELAWVNFRVRNVGFRATSAPVVAELTLDEQWIATRTAATLGPGEALGAEPFPSFVPAGGSHQLALTVDANADIAESDESDNVANRTLSVALALPDLEPAKPSDWTASILVVASATATTESTLFAGQQGFVRWAIANTGRKSADSFRVVLELDGSEIARTTLTDVDPGETVTAPSATPLVLPAGSHQLRLRIDTDQEIAESDENDNQTTRFLSWSNAPDLAFIAPGGWSDPVVLNATELSTVASQLLDGSRVFLRWSATNAGAAVSPSYWVRIRVDGGVLDQFIASGLDVGETFTSDPIPIFLDAGSHLIQVDLDGGEAIAELNEGNNLWEKTVTVVDSSAAVELQPGADHPYTSPIVANNVKGGTSTPTNLFAGTTYFSFFATNWGRQSAAQSFVLKLELDGSLVFSCDVLAGLARDRSDGCKELALQVAAGTHTVRLTVDSANSVPETVESNNVWTQTLVWR